MNIYAHMYTCTHDMNAYMCRHIWICMCICTRISIEANGEDTDLFLFQSHKVDVSFLLSLRRNTGWTQT